MQRGIARTLVKHTFWISLLLHLLLLLSFSLVLVLTPDREEKPQLYIPSYTYQSPVKPIVKQTDPQKPQNPQKPEQKKPSSKNGIEKPASSSNSQSADIPTKADAVSMSKSVDGVNIVGDKKLDKPLIKILGQAIGRQLIYPRIAMDFNLRGVAYVGFTLRPDGYVTNVKLVKSSNAGVLDDEAVRAISSISPVRGVDPYVKEPKFMIVGIIFG